MTLPTRHLYKGKQVVYVIAACVFCLHCACSVVIACLLAYPLSYTDVVAIFLFIH